MTLESRSFEKRARYLNTSEIVSMLERFDGAGLPDWGMTSRCRHAHAHAGAKHGLLHVTEISKLTLVIVMVLRDSTSDLEPPC
jgi:hypothetical protein